MLDIYSQFRDFHIFKKFKYLLGQWWDIDILVVVKRKDQFFYDSLPQLKNPVVKDLLSSSLFKNYFLKSLQTFLKEKKNPDIVLKKFPWKQTGLNLLVVPLVLKDKPLEALLVTTGFAPHNEKKLFQALSYLNFSQKAMEQKIKKLKTLSPKDNVYIEKMLEILAEEFFSLLQERKKQNEIIKTLTRRQGQRKYGSLIGKSSAMYYLFKALEKVTKQSAHLLIEGEKGTGKRLLAKNIHEQSLRSKGPFYSYNCSHFKRQLLEFEIFGYVKGAFPKASKDKKALLEKLDGGTLVLNNIEDSQPSFQARLLKYLKNSVFFNEGSSQVKKANVRILALTSRNLKVFSEQGEGGFNKELFLALSGIHLKVPALRQRKTDIPALVDYFLTNKTLFKKKGFSVKAMKALYQYSWPGNVQELESEIDRVLALNRDNTDFFKFEDLSLHIRSASSQWTKILQDKKQNLKQTLHTVEKNILKDSLRQNNWNKTKVARQLGISRTSVIFKKQRVWPA